MNERLWKIITVAFIHRAIFANYPNTQIKFPMTFKKSEFLPFLILTLYFIKMPISFRFDITQRFSANDIGKEARENSFTDL